MIALSRLSSASCTGAGDPGMTGGRAAALGGCTIALSDPWSGFNNPAGLGWQRSIAAGAFYENRYLVSELGDRAAGVILPVRAGTFGVTLQYTGFTLYNEMRAGLAFGRCFSTHFSAGIRIGYLRIHIGEGYGNRNLVTCDIGCQFRPGRKLTAGIHLSNPVPVRISPHLDEPLPVVIRAGIAWQPATPVTLCLEVEEVLSGTPSVRAGVEYRMAKPVTLRVGFMTNPTAFTFGFGIELSRFRLDLSSSYHLFLGYSPQASMTYVFPERP
jgi:hypothetical protein